MRFENTNMYCIEFLSEKTDKYKRKLHGLVLHNKETNIASLEVYSRVHNEGFITYGLDLNQSLQGELWIEDDEKDCFYCAVDCDPLIKDSHYIFNGIQKNNKRLYRFYTVEGYESLPQLTFLFAKYLSLFYDNKKITENVINPFFNQETRKWHTINNYPEIINHFNAGQYNIALSRYNEIKKEVIGI